MVQEGQKGKAPCQKTLCRDLWQRPTKTSHRDSYRDPHWDLPQRPTQSPIRSYTETSDRGQHQEPSWTPFQGWSSRPSHTYLMQKLSQWTIPRDFTETCDRDPHRFLSDTPQKMIWIPTHSSAEPTQRLPVPCRHQRHTLNRGLTSILRSPSSHPVTGPAWIWSHLTNWQCSCALQIKGLVYFLITYEKDLDSPCKPEKSFPSQIFIAWAPTHSLKNQKLKTKLCHHLMREELLFVQF